MSNCDKVIASLSYLGIQPKIQSYNSRFLMQKITFLAQELGISTNYYFTPYIKGPYSPSLTKDYFGRRTQFEALESSYELTQADIARLETIKGCQLFENHDLMEATATALYFVNRLPPTRDCDMFVHLKRVKPHLSETSLIIGISKCKELKFKPEYLTDELKAEFKGWNSLSSGSPKEDETEA